VRRTRSRTPFRIIAAGLLAASLVGCGGAQPQLESLPLDLAGRAVDPFASGDARVRAFVFVSSECPVSNRLAPEIRRIAAAVSDQRVDFWLVYPDPKDTPDRIRTHLAEYGYADVAVLRDPEHALVAAADITFTPEAAVYDARGNRVYRGRVNDRFVAFGRTRPAPTRNDLEAALEATLAGRAVAIAETEAIGCYTSDLR
jgi:hypothetical protein